MFTHRSSLQRKVAPLLPTSRAPRGLLPTQLWGFSHAPPHCTSVRCVAHCLGRCELLHLPWHLSSATAPLPSCSRDNSAQRVLEVRPTECHSVVVVTDTTMLNAVLFDRTLNKHVATWDCGALREAKRPEVHISRALHTRWRKGTHCGADQRS